MPVNIQHNVILFGQPTNMTCWSAATTMLLGTNMSVSSGAASTGITGGLLPSHDNVKTFAQSHGLRFYAPQSWTANGLIELIKRGPFALFGFFDALHVIVVGGIQSDGTEIGTTLTIFDPAPAGTGRIYWVNYYTLMRRSPFASIFILQK